MRRAVAFSKSIKASQQTTDVFSDLVGMYQKIPGAEQHGMVECTLHHVDGGMNAAIRKDTLDWLKARRPALGMPWTLLKANACSV